MNNKNNEKLAIVITDKKIFGNILTPYIIDFSRAPIYSTIEQITPTKLESTTKDYTDTELYIIQQLNKLSEQSLFHKFSKEKTVKAFTEKTNETVIESVIRPYIDKITLDVLHLIIKNNIPIFHKKNNYNNFYETDIVATDVYPDQTRFHFGITENKDLIYALKLALNGQEISLFKNNIIEITHEPASFLLSNKLYHFKNISIKKFRPFLQRNSILVQHANVKKYMETFVTQCIKDHYVVAHGFNIIKRQSPCKSILSLEYDIYGYNFYLFFEYNKKRYPYGQNNKHVELEYSDDSYTFYTQPRHTAQELQVMFLLNEIGLHAKVNNLLVCDSINNNQTPGALIAWLNEHIEYLDEHEIKVEINTNEKYYLGSVNLQIDFDEKTDWFDINCNVLLNGFNLPIKLLRNNIINNDPIFHLPDGSIFIIPNEWFATWYDIFTFAYENGDSLRFDKRHSSILPKEFFLTDGISTDFTISNTQRQGELLASLRPYQEDGFRWMNTLYENNKGGLLADDMGLGKTIQTIALLSHIYETAPRIETTLNNLSLNNTALAPSLIVVPVSLMHNWINEIKKFAPHLSIYNYSGRNRIRSKNIGNILRNYHIVITSYGLLRNDNEYLSQYAFTYIILDESQYIKNPSSKIYHAVMQLNGSHKLTISGTPIENKLVDMWSQMNFINPGLLGSLSFFRHYFETPITKGNNQDKETKLKKMIAPFILRRTKEMVAKDLPPISYQTLYCTMSDEQKSLYEKEKSSYRNELWGINNKENPKSVSSLIALQALTRLRLIANHPVLVDPNYSGDSGKFNIILEKINSILSEGHKILIFSSFVKDLSIISKSLTSQHIEHCFLTGATKDRKKVIDDFNSDNNKNVFLISLKAGGVGLNLTSADYVFILNPWWNPQAEAQAINRAHRIGQTKNVFVYRFISVDTLEEKIDKLQEKKKGLADNFIFDNNPLNVLTEEEIKELFE